MLYCLALPVSYRAAMRAPEVIGAASGGQHPGPPSEGPPATRHQEATIYLRMLKDGGVNELMSELQSLLVLKKRTILYLISLSIG